jgi:predicted MPP superfamily phosphohydrolase
MTHEKIQRFSDIVGKVIPKYQEPVIAQEAEVEHFDLNFLNLPNNFEGTKLIHISDLHNVDLFGQRSDLLDSVTAIQPEYIVISGDSINNHQIENAVKTVSALDSIPCVKQIFVVYGNHEFDSGKEIRDFSLSLKNTSKKAKIIRDTSFKIEKDGQSIYVVGIDDPQGYQQYEQLFSQNMINLAIRNVPRDSFKILISHRPELIDLYSRPEYKIDLVLSGHAHGGQYEIPVIKRRVFAPNQGFLPKITKGIYVRQKTTELVNPGLANDFKLPRVPGAIYSITLHKTT